MFLSPVFVAVRPLRRDRPHGLVGALTLTFDARILSEYDEVLRRPKFNFEEDRIVALLDHIEHRGQTAASAPLSHSLPDPDDEPSWRLLLPVMPYAWLQEIRVIFPAGCVRGLRSFSAEF